jgi:hypothetical protein
MYRAVPIIDLPAKAVLRRLPTSRVPVNISYLVDNIWERLRPHYAPSRRQAIFASPSAKQALESASQSGASDNVVCELIVRDVDCRVAHLSEPDAKYHRDVKHLTAVASPLFASLFHNMPDNEKLVYAPLFMPGTSAETTMAILRRPELAPLAAVAASCTMWKEASFEPVPGHPGELYSTCRPMAKPSWSVLTKPAN